MVFTRDLEAIFAKDAEEKLKAKGAKEKVKKSTIRLDEFLVKPKRRRMVKKELIDVDEKVPAHEKMRPSLPRNINRKKYEMKV